MEQEPTGRVQGLQANSRHEHGFRVTRPFVPC